MTVWSGQLQCDDGNNVNTDGCSNSGIIRQGFICTQKNAAFIGSPDLCVESCGDGLDLWLVNSNLRCDDGNNISGDGCDKYCYIEPGFYKNSQG